MQCMSPIMASTEEIFSSTALQLLPSCLLMQIRVGT